MRGCATPLLLVDVTNGANKLTLIDVCPIHRERSVNPSYGQDVENLTDS